jgi:hypothetical protein
MWENRRCSILFHLLAWGGQELYELCSGGKKVDGFSPFQQLKQIRIPALGKEELERLLQRQFGSVAGADALYGLTRGHPALVQELLEQEEAAELLNNGTNDSELHSRLLISEHMKLLRRYIDDSAEVKDLLQRLLGGDSLRANSAEEDHLYWLGIIIEQDADNWRWSAPIMIDWARNE